MFSGREQVQSAVTIAYPPIGLARYHQAWLQAVAGAFQATSPLEGGGYHPHLNPLPSRDRILQFQGHHTNQAYYKSGIIFPEYTIVELKAL